MNAAVSKVINNSPAHEAGLEKGDVLMSVNGNPVRDVIDYMFFSRDGVMDLKIQRGNRNLSIRIKARDRSGAGFELKPFKTRACRNKCVFCFVDQLPKGLRKSLYLKDEDYRMSFLYGNYVTLTNLSAADKKRIKEQRLSPLYISVHTTDNDLRKRMLGNNRAPDILGEIQELASSKIRMHTQLVLCPGLNDGKHLSKTIMDLQKFYPYVASIAVVPVGVTKFRKGYSRNFDKADAVKALDIIRQLRKRFKKRHGDPIVHPSDELYIKAGANFPSAGEYGDFPQIENGVGLVPAFLNSARKLKIPKKIEARHFVTFTGASFMPYFEEYCQRLKSVEGLTLEVFKIENKFFGPSVSVTGLLTGRDVLKTIMGKTTPGSCLLVPDVVLRDGRDMFLDNVTLKDMEESLGIQALPVESTPDGLLKGITNGCKWKD